MEWQQLLNCNRRKDNLKKTSIEFLHPLASGKQEIERDYDRLLFAAPTRRLADKTQVFPLDQNDSIRTRLTHSHEVANFSRGIGMRLAFEMKEHIFGEIPTRIVVERDVPALLAAIGLAHDLGNPPFGHQGEAAMRAWFNKNLPGLLDKEVNSEIYNDFLQFDGNSQTLRLVTKLQIINDNFGLNLTYATLAALIKYPRASYSSDKHWKKHGFFYSEHEVVMDVWQQTGLGVPGNDAGCRHPFTWIMEACDDIAYSVLDAEDTIKKGFASYQDLRDFLMSQSEPNDVIQHVIEAVEAKNDAWKEQRNALSPAEINELSMQMFRVYATSALINAVVEAFREQLPTLMQRDCPFKDLISQSKGHALCTALKMFDRTRGYLHRSVLQLELRGSNYITNLMDMLWIGIHGHKTKKERDGERESASTDNLFVSREEYLSDTPFGRYAYGTISENYRRVFEDPANTLPILYKEAQLLTDAISGMTDSYLMRLHDELKSLYECGLKHPTA